MSAHGEASSVEIFRGDKSIVLPDLQRAIFAMG